MFTASAFQAVEVFDINGLQIAKEHNQDRQSDGGLGGGHRENEEHENLARGIAEIMRKSDEIHVHRQQHELDRHQQDQHVLAVQEYPDHADREKDRAQYQVMLQRNHFLPL